MRAAAAPRRRRRALRRRRRRARRRREPLPRRGRRRARRGRHTSPWSPSSTRRSRRRTTSTSCTRSSVRTSRWTSVPRPTRSSSRSSSRRRTSCRNGSCSTGTRPCRWRRGASSPVTSRRPARWTSWIATQNPHENRATISRVTGLRREPGARPHGRRRRRLRAEVLHAARGGRGRAGRVPDSGARSSGSRTAASTSSPRRTTRVDVAHCHARARRRRPHPRHVHRPPRGRRLVPGRRDRWHRAVRRPCCSPARTASRRWRWRCRVVWTNTSGRGAYRGPWMFETVAREEMIDLAARGDRASTRSSCAGATSCRPPSCRTSPPTGHAARPGDARRRRSSRRPRSSATTRSGPSRRARSRGGPAARHRHRPVRRADQHRDDGPARGPRPRSSGSSPGGTGHGVPRHRLARPGHRDDDGAGRRRGARRRLRRRDGRAGRHRRHRLRSRYRRQPHRGHRRAARAATRRCRCAISRWASPPTSWRPRPRISRSSTARCRCAARRCATSPSPRSPGSRTTPGPSCPPGMRRGLEATVAFKAPPVHVVERVPRVLGRGRPAHRAWSRSSATSSARTAA